MDANEVQLAQPPHPAGAAEDVLLADCNVKRVRRSGPGGQHRNKVETGIVLEHRGNGVRVEASERRSQEQNRQTAVRRLRIALAVQVRCTAEAAASALWRSRVGNRRIVVSTEHADFPVLLAEALDVLHAAEYEPQRAAQRLRVTASQFVKLVKREPAAFALVNRAREDRGLKRLR